MDVLQNLFPVLLYLFLALFPLVLVHELGHFIVAKRSGVHVEEFGFGFPPRLVRLFHAGGTDYTLNLLPLGGFVRLVGEDDPDVPGAFAAKGKATRAAVLVAGPAANFLLAAVLFTGVAMAGFNEALPGLRGVLVAAVEDEMPARAAGMAPGDIIVAVNGEPLAGAVDAVDTEQGTPEMQRLTQITDQSTGTALAVTVLRGLERVEFEGNLANASTAPADEAWWPGGSRVLADTPAVGIQAGDIIVAPRQDAAAAGSGEPVVVRYTEQIELSVTPSYDEKLEQGRMGIVISPASLAVKFGIVGSIGKGMQLTAMSITGIAGALTDILSKPDNLAGPIGIGKISRNSAQGGVMSFLGFMALLSVNLGLINLLPIPALDGGRLLFVGLEAVRGRRIEPSREQLVHVIGFVVVIGLMLVLTAREVADLIGFGQP